jgi:hypothetical protein
MRSLKVAVTAIISFCLIGCAASGAKYGGPTALDPNSSEIVVYRPDRFARGGVSYLVYIDGKEVAKLKNAGFVLIPTSPGSHELEIQASAFQNFKPIKVPANTTAGARLFFRFEPFMSGGPVVLPTVMYIPVAYSLVPVPEAQALIELRELRHSE